MFRTLRLLLKAGGGRRQTAPREEAAGRQLSAVWSVPVCMCVGGGGVGGGRVRKDSDR